MNNPKVWPYAISISIALIFLASVATVVISLNAPVQKSDTYMMDYHDADDKANEIIKESIEFNKKYNISFSRDEFSQKEAVLKYKITDKDAKPINEANIKIILTRPDNHQSDIKLDKFNIKDGIYTFEKINLPKEGRWDIMAKINIGKDSRFYNLKVDTRNNTVVEY